MLRNLIVTLMLTPAVLATGIIPIPSEPDHVISLNGTWRFKLEQAKGRETRPENWNTKVPIDYPATFEPFFQPDYTEDASWHDIPVPGNWEMAGHSPATYNQPDNASAFYRLTFDVPESWKGRRVLVNFDAVQNAAEIYLNGQPVTVSEPAWDRPNYHESGWTAWQADLTPHVKFGDKNLIALRVTKNTKSADLDSGDYFFLGGIYRPVTLFSVPENHVADITVTTKMIGRDAQFTITGTVQGPSPKSVHTHAWIDLGQGDLGGIIGSPDDQGRFLHTVLIPDVRLWSAEFPNLYTVHFELRGDGQTLIQRITRRIGVREISTRNGVLLLNNTPIKLAGMCRHDVYPTKGTAVDEDVWRKDITLMKAANINCIRTSHYPYGTRFYDLCDELGMYVIDELPYCWCPTKDESLFPAFLQRCRETVARDKNHTCVIIWGIGNENGPGPALQHVADLLKTLDPTRPSLVSRQPAEKFGTALSDSHYTNPDKIAQAAAAARKNGHPHIYTENPNNWDIRLGADASCWDAWAPVLQRVWAVCENQDTIPGTCLWEWQDRAVADQCPTKLYEFDPATGINYLKLKGIVDAFRNPRPSYYHVKMIYSPIKVDPAIDRSPDSITLSIANHYSFTDLSTLSANWTLFGRGKPLPGTAHLPLAPRTTGKLRLQLPPSALAGADMLQLSFDHPDGRNIVTHQFHLAPPLPAQPLNLTLPPGLTFPRLNLITSATKQDKAKWRVMTRHAAHLINLKKDPPASGDLLADIRSIDADAVLDSDPATTVARVHAEYSKKIGTFSYRFDWTGRKQDILEIGWSFPMPAQYHRFSWHREAPWSYYPDTHIGRPAGTALPDSAAVHYTNWSRPDAFDFNSTKYNCNSASLTNDQPAGLRVEFAPTARHQCKAAILPDNQGYALIVNHHVNPPTDISSPVVRDLYLSLDKGDKVESSFRIGSVP